jgi:D-alanyl-D-alanine-carboxypeptidase/D-alanyl-D-alanine-endopeptidase
MKRWFRIVLMIAGSIAAVIVSLATYIYLQVDTRVDIDGENGLALFSNTKNIVRLDSTTISPDSINNYVEVLRRKAGVTGLAVSIINNGDVVYQQYFGERNHAKRETFTPGTIFYGASFSKTLLADITLQLVSEGLLDLDSPLYKYLHKPLPQYETGTLARFFGANNYDYRDLDGDGRYKKITARMCLSHTTGLPNWRWIEADGKLKFKFEPGQRYSYSGEGMFLLQLALEELSGQDFEELADQKIFYPLHLQRSSFVWQRAYEGHYAVGHDVDGNFLGIPKRNVPNAAGSLSTSLEEFTAYFNTVLGEGEPRYRLMTSKQISIPFKQQFGPEAMVETQDNDAIQLGYGLGYGVYQTPYGRAFFKEGHGEGWQHYAVGFPDRKTALILMSNSDNAENIFKTLIEFTIGNKYTPWYWENYIPHE